MFCYSFSAIWSLQFVKAKAIIFETLVIMLPLFGQTREMPFSILQNGAFFHYCDHC
jgi:hypothetical protein